MMPYMMTNLESSAPMLCLMTTITRFMRPPRMSSLTSKMAFKITMTAILWWAQTSPIERALAKTKGPSQQPTRSSQTPCTRNGFCSLNTWTTIISCPPSTIPRTGGVLRKKRSSTARECKLHQESNSNLIIQTKISNAQSSRLRMKIWSPRWKRWRRKLAQEAAPQTPPIHWRSMAKGFWPLTRYQINKLKA